MTGGNGSRGAGGHRTDRGVSGTEFAGVGIQFAASILVFVFLGVWLDRRLGTSPWFVIVGVCVGAGGGFFSMYRKMIAPQRGSADRGGKAGGNSGGNRDTERRS